jgi:outer membrane protein assembly factor BamB
MATNRSTIVGILLIAGLAAPATPILAADASGDWPMFKGDAGRAGMGVDGPDSEPVVRWRYDAGAPITDNVAIVGDLVLAASNDGVLHALDIASSQVLWRYAPASLVSGPTVYQDSAYVFVDGNDLVSLGLDGEIGWTTPDVGPGPTNPTVGDGAVYFGTADGDLVAVDAATGDERWRTQVDDTSGAVHRPAFADGRVHVASDGGGYVAVDAVDGDILWRFDTDAYATGTAVVSDGIAYIGAGAPEGRLWALDAAAGEEIWRVDEAYSNPSIADGIAFAGSAALGVAAFDVATGDPIWVFPIEGVARPMAVAEGVVYVPADQERRLYAIDASNGDELWHMELDAGTDCCVAVADGAAFVGTWSGSLYAIGSVGDGRARVTPSTPPAAVVSPNPFTVIETLEPSLTGLSGVGDIAFGPDGNLYVVQTAPAAIVVLSPDGTPIRSFGSPGAGPGELDFADRWPAIAVDQDGLVYVTEAGNARVSVFESDGTFVRHVGSFGDEPGRFLLPFDVVVDDAGGILVADDMQRTASRFAADGAFEWRLDPHSDPDFQGGYFHGGGVDANGRTWLTNDSTGMVLAFDTDGTKVESWSVMDEALGSGLLGPCQLALDAVGNTYVLDCSNRSFAVFDPERRLIGAWVGPDPLPFGAGYAFGPDWRLYALAGGDRADGGTVDQPDAILVMDVVLPVAE